jgi:FixJ family two-component response regulator
MARPNWLTDNAPLETGSMPPQLAVFVVDDDPGMRRALGRLLAAAGMTSVEFDSAEALLGCNCRAPDCIVSDIQLPKLSGFEMAKLANDRFGTVPIIFITAFDSPAARAAVSRQPACGYLVKPFAGEDLLEAIRKATERQLE